MPTGMILRRLRLAEKSGYRYLNTIDSPADLKKLQIEELMELAGELRQFIIETVAQTGGHLGSNLGSIELTLAMHYVYNTPVDQIIWDVGAQAYSHKIITGRRDRFHTNRQYGGVAGFPARDESEYDSFGVGHSSTSISAALGMASARDLNKQKFKVLAIIGDGGMTGGMAFEGLNQAGVSNTDMTVVYNDNSMAISPNVGALSNLFSNLRADLRFEKIKDNMWELAGRLPSGNKLRKALRGMDEGLRAMMMPGLWFERLGFRYVGPIDGHDLSELVSMFKWLKTATGPIVVHVLTKKGKGYSAAEADSTHLHGVSKFDVNTGPAKVKKTADDMAFCEHFSDELLKIATEDERVCAITPAMIEGSALGKFQKKFPERCFDVGIAEQHALTFAAGLATQGIKPVVAIYSSFLQRAFDQLIHDIAIQKLPVVLGVDRAGLVGEDGRTHHGAFDISFLRLIPGLSIFVPRDGQQLRMMLREGMKVKDGPVAIRFPRGKPPRFVTGSKLDSNVWSPEYLRDGSDGVFVSAGPILENCLKVADEIRKSSHLDIAVLDMRCLKPFDEIMMLDAADRFKRWLIVEENALLGGMGSMLIEFLQDNGRCDVEVLRAGLPDRFITHGDRPNLLKDVKLDVDSLLNMASSFFRSQNINTEKKVRTAKV